MFLDTGTYVVFGGKVTNYGGEVFGRNDFTTALTLSINTTFGKVGNDVGRRRLIEASQRFGFYATPPLPLPAGEIVPSGRYGKNGLLAAGRLHGPAGGGLGGVRSGEAAGHAAADGARGGRRGQRRPRDGAVLPAGGHVGVGRGGPDGQAARVEDGHDGRPPPAR